MTRPWVTRGAILEGILRRILSVSWDAGEDGKISGVSSRPGGGVAKLRALTRLGFGEGILDPIVMISHVALIARDEGGVSCEVGTRGPREGAASDEAAVGAASLGQKRGEIQGGWVAFCVETWVDGDRLGGARADFRMGIMGADLLTDIAAEDPGSEAAAEAVVGIVDVAEDATALDRKIRDAAASVQDVALRFESGRWAGVDAPRAAPAGRRRR